MSDPDNAFVIIDDEEDTYLHQDKKMTKEDRELNRLEVPEDE